MLLAINANNTNVKFALYRGEQPLGSWRLSTHPGRTADEYMVWLSQLMTLAKLDLKAVKGAVIATVVPPTLFHLKQLCRQYFDCEPLVLGEPEVKLGIEVRLERPQEVGADRLANAVGGHLLLAGALIVVDFGTATTFDVVDADGHYCGGVISPGINLSLEALHGATAKLPRIAIERPRQAIGRDTLGAMQSGIYWGYVGLIEGLVGRIRAEWAQPMKTIATGGLAPVFFGQTPALDRHEPDLTMRGLVEIFRRNRGPV